MRTVLCIGLLSMVAQVYGVELYVAPNGNDDNAGTKAQPFRTLEAARDEIRKNRTSNIEHSTSNIESETVYLRGGMYLLDKTFMLEPEDSQTTYTAYPGETPVLSGARSVTGWKPLRNEPVAVADEAKGKLWVANVEPGWRFHFLFVNGRRAQRARWQNTDKWRGWAKDHSASEPEPKVPQTVTLKSNKAALEHVPSNGDTEMVCIMAQFGVMINGVITGVDAEKGTFLCGSQSMYIRKSRNPHERGYNLENALAFIDEPGEWCIDSASGLAYYWPLDDENMAKADVVAPKLYELVRMQGREPGELVRNVTFSGITMQQTDRLPENEWPEGWLTRQWENVDAMVYMSGVEDCVIRDCRMLNSGSYGIMLHHHAQRNRLEGNEIGWTGSGGIFLQGYGPGTHDVNRENVVIRNHVHDHGLANYWHSPSIQVYGSGSNHISLNLMQRSAYSGFSMVGCHPKYFSTPAYFFKGDYAGLRHEWNYFQIRTEDFPQEIQDGVRNGTYKFDRETIKPYLHASNNIVERNVVVEPHSLLNEGGAFYTWCPGKGNVWHQNVIFVSHAMPGSSVLALDDIAEYHTVTDNIFWVNGRILNGVGARRGERGNEISGNIRVLFKPVHSARIKRGLGSWWKNVSEREPLDKLCASIQAEVNKQGGWIGNPEIGIPEDVAVEQFDLSKVKLLDGIRVNFQTKNLKTPDGWMQDCGKPFALRPGGESYGWSRDMKASARERKFNKEPLLDSLVHFVPEAAWELALPNGEYKVQICCGDAKHPCPSVEIKAEGKVLNKKNKSDASDFLFLERTVDVKDGRLTLSSHNLPENSNSTRINFICVEAERVLPEGSNVTIEE